MRRDSSCVEEALHSPWRLDGRAFVFDGSCFTLDGESYGPLKGESTIDIREDGAFVNTERRGDWTASQIEMTRARLRMS
jgi:hypothetical protein